MADILSVECPDGLRCVDVLVLPGSGYGFKEFRRDPEDGGGWRLVADYSGTSYRDRDEALRAARRTIGWLQTPCGPRETEDGRT